MNYYNEIKKELINNEVYSKVKDYSKNKHDLETKYNVGKLLYDAGNQYGENIIEKYSTMLTKELNKKYDQRTLRKYRQFYFVFKDSNWSTLSTNLNFSHYVELISIDDINKINYYINIAARLNLTVRGLRTRIKSKEYERLDDNTKLKLINNEDTTLPDIIKNPIVINNPHNYDVIKEKTLQLLIMEDLYNFLKELGEVFTYVGKIKKHIGQIETYMHYIDTNVKNIYHDKTIGIILCRKDNELLTDRYINFREGEYLNEK